MSENTLSLIWMSSFFILVLFELYYPFRLRLYGSIAAGTYVSFIVSLFNFRAVYSCIAFLSVTLLIYFTIFFISLISERKRSMLCVALSDIQHMTCGYVLCDDMKIRYVENNNFFTINKGTSTKVTAFEIKENKNGL